MSVSYLGKSPSRLWTFWQNTKGLMRSFRQEDSKREAQAFRREAGKSAGIFGIGLAMNTVTLISAIPFVPFIGAVAALGGGFYFARNARMKYNNIKKTTSFRNYISNAEIRWVNVQKQGGPIKAFLNTLKRGAQKTGSFIGTTIGSIGLIGGAAAGLVVSNVWPAATTAITQFTTSVLPTLALTTATLSTAIGIGVVAAAGGLILRAKCRRALKNPEKKSLFNLPPTAYQTDDAVGNKYSNTLESKGASQDFNTAYNDNNTVSEERRIAAERRAEERAKRRQEKKPRF